MARSGFDATAFNRKLKRLPAVVKARVNEAIAKDAAEWVSLSKSLAPKDPIEGVYLEPSIRHYQTETGGQIVRAGGATTTRPAAGGPYDYAVGQEFGTQDMPAQPYFWPVYRSLRKKFKSRRARALKKAMKEL